MSQFVRVIFCLCWIGLTVGCSQETIDDQNLYYGEFEVIPEDGKSDSLGVAEIPVSADQAETAVWEVNNAWADTDTPAAKKAGLAWGEDSGLNWNEKYVLWVDSLPRINAHNGSNKTFEMITPQGKRVPAPVLECAEVAYFLRVTFAAWHQLPFFVQAIDPQGTTIYMGHFGWRTKSGRYKNTPLFKTRYKDYSGQEISLEDWPRDERLRARSLWGASDDFQPFIDAGARAGAYFDELYLNKRVGHFLMYLLTNFGSIHLANSLVTFNKTAQSLKAGDVLVERYERTGIGHTLVVKHVEDSTTAGTLKAELVSGSMPRRQPVWEEASTSKYYFTSQDAGGSAFNSDGDMYASLGGGLKGFRIARKLNGYYINTILEGDLENWINSTDLETLGARPDEFQYLLDGGTPQDQIDTLTAIIDRERNHLRQYPASCAARARREAAFTNLYALCNQQYNQTTKEVDLEYRLLEDYVLAELVYDQSKTCCWNSTNTSMYQVIMDYNRRLSGMTGTCEQPEVFMNNDGYSNFFEHAQSMGLDADWVAWSEDETCPQRDVVADTEEEHLWTPFCEIKHALQLKELEHFCPTDIFEPNNSFEQARLLEAGEYQELFLCSTSDDWFRIQIPAGSFSATIEFDHGIGDLELALHIDPTDALYTSTSSDDIEAVEYENPEDREVFIRVYGYDNEAVNSYTLKLVSTPAAQCLPDSFEPNDSFEQGRLMEPGEYNDLTRCAQNDDWYQIQIPAGSFSATIEFDHAAGDLDLALHDDQMGELATSISSNSIEIVEHESIEVEEVFLRVYGYHDDVSNDYSLKLVRTPAGR
jgi:hypothetical protein